MLQVFDTGSLYKILRRALGHLHPVKDRDRCRCSIHPLPMAPIPFVIVTRREIQRSE